MGVRWLSEEEQAAWRGLQRMQARLGAALNRQLSAEAGMSLQDYGVLVALTDRPDGRMRPFELGRELGWEKSRLSHHITRMTGRGLVTREQCPSDQRGWFVAITDHGRAAIEAAAVDHVATVRRFVLDPLSPEQVEALAGITEAVLAALQDECEEQPGT